MTLDDLRDYNKWKNQSPVVIRKAAIDAGGWAKVFPLNRKVGLDVHSLPIGPMGGQMPVVLPTYKAEDFPLWASRVRNYFNVAPVTLKLLPPLQGRSMANEYRGFHVFLPQLVQKIVFSLNSDVYVDEHGRPWLNMNKPGGVYHIPGVVDAKKMLQAIASELALAPFPIFKLISPDGTGGSCEVCLHNVKQRATIGAVGEVVNVSPDLVKDELYRGSYNYAETVERGLPEHDFADIKPHHEHEGFYVNPPLYSAIDSRRFPPMLSNFNPLRKEWK